MVGFAVANPELAGKYHRARWMDPSTGRFGSVDPFTGVPTEPIMLHKYLYTGADPVNNVDPTGEFSVVTVAAVTAIVGTLAAIATVQALSPRSQRFGFLGGGVAIVSFSWQNQFVLGREQLDATDVETIKLWAYQTMRQAFSGLTVSLSEGSGTNYITVNDNYPPGNAGDTRLFFARTSDVNFGILAGLARSYTPPGTARSELMAAIGRGVGATSAHEFAHQMQVGHQDFDANAYDYDSADNAQHFYGQLHWTPGAWQRLQQRLSY
jgi:RHS repeat-associated protein